MAENRSTPAKGTSVFCFMALQLGILHHPRATAGFSRRTLSVRPPTPVAGLGHGGAEGRRAAERRGDPGAAAGDPPAGLRTGGLTLGSILRSFAFSAPFVRRIFQRILTIRVAVWNLRNCSVEWQHDQAVEKKRRGSTRDHF